MTTIKGTLKIITSTLINLDIDFSKRGNRIVINDYFTITVSKGDNAIEVFYLDSKKDKDFLSTNETIKSCTETIKDFLK